MAPTRGRLEGKVTVPAGGWTGTIDDSAGGSAAAWSVAAGTYYLSSAGSMGSSLLDAFVTALNAATPTDTIAATLSAGEAGTGKVTITSTGTAAIVFTSTDLRDLLGFAGNLAAGTSWTGTAQARALWLPDCPYKAPNGVGSWRGWREADFRSLENAAGYSFAHMGQEKEVNALSWNAVSRARTWEANATTDNASWERFARDCIWGVASWASPGGPIRFYPDAADSAIYATYKVVDFATIKPEPLIEDYAAGPHRVFLPRLIADPSDDTGLPRLPIVVTDLAETGSNVGGTSFTTASVSISAGALVLVAIHSHGTGGGNSVPTVVTGAGGLTFTRVDASECVNFSGGTAYKNLTLWRAYTSSATSGTISITVAGTATRIAWSICQATGVSSSGSNGAGAIVQYKTNVSLINTPASATFDAAISHPNNVNLSAFGFSSAGTSYTAASGFTQMPLAQPLSGAAIGGSFGYKTAAATSTVTTGNNIYHAIIMLELAAGT